MTETTASSREYHTAHGTSRVRALGLRARAARLHGWLFVAPALAAYGLFVLWPLVQSFKYSLYEWDGVAAARWVGLDNFRTVFSDPQLVSVLEHAFELIIFFSGIPVVLGLVLATVMRRIATRRISSAAQ